MCGCRHKKTMTSLDSTAVTVIICRLQASQTSQPTSIQYIPSFVAATTYETVQKKQIVSSQETLKYGKKERRKKN